MSSSACVAIRPIDVGIVNTQVRLAKTTGNWHENAMSVVWEDCDIATPAPKLLSQSSPFGIACLSRFFLHGVRI